MEGIDIKLDYIAERSRWKSLFVPFALLPILVLLYLWVGQNNIVNYMEYKAIHSYDSSFNLKLSSLDEGIQNRFITAKNAVSVSHSSTSADNTEQGVGGYVNYFLNYMSLAFIIWAMIFISMYTLLYSLLLFMPVAALLLCTEKYPSWLYTWNKEALSYFVRVMSFFLLVSPNFPAIDDAKDITVTIPRPQSDSLSRWQPLVKWFFAIPHILVLLFLFIIVVFIGFFSYLYTIATGTYPKFAFNFIVKYLRWSLRVICYAHILVTDKYPPFSFK